ncbi:MAG: hypothetical protein JJ926_03815 [Roseitalea sp.]|nr:hypothetical protein [Roseitalea sp.]MBO6950983.1 hypothetical protein [Rhizobiaceae bacterium]MBO6591030.1 hypothetical protein [Roseitalea sp.]MBO6599712.1 hypothetical protein [Roseitalea sp.]MBO6611468.1 hypothetical protein [Roseitalea sp.]
MANTRTKPAAQDAPPKAAVPDPEPVGPIASPKASVADSATAKDGGAGSWFVTETGRATGKLRKRGDRIMLTDRQAKFLALGGHISKDEPAAKAAD